jgi:hypothetical protein
LDLESKLKDPTDEQKQTFFYQGTKNYIKINKCKNKKSKYIIIITKARSYGKNIVYPNPLALYNVLYFAF